MTNAVGHYIPNENPLRFNLTHVNCKIAHHLFNQVLVIKDIGENQLLEELNKDVLKSTSEDEWKKIAIFKLVKIAFTSSKVGEAIIDAAEKYDHPEDSKWYHYFNRFFYTLENHLPRCDFHTDSPVNRERYVVCNQMIYYFSLLKTSSIFKECGWDFFNSNDNPMPLESLGSFIFFSEILSKETHTIIVNSWTLRREWNEELKMSFCEKNNYIKTKWHHYLCEESEGKLPDLYEQNYAYWKNHIYKFIMKNGGVYSSAIQSEIKNEICKQSVARELFEKKASSMASFFDQRFEQIETTLTSSKKNEETMNKILDYKNQLDHLFQNYNRIPSQANWIALQNHVDSFELLIKSKPLGQEYSHIEALLEKAKQLKKPSSQMSHNEL